MIISLSTHLFKLKLETYMGLILLTLPQRPVEAFAEAYYPLSSSPSDQPLVCLLGPRPPLIDGVSLKSLLGGSGMERGRGIGSSHVLLSRQRSSPPHAHFPALNPPPNYPICSGPGSVALRCDCGAPSSCIITGKPPITKIAQCDGGLTTARSINVRV